MHHLGIRRKLMRYVELQVKIEITKAIRSRNFPVCKLSQRRIPSNNQAPSSFESICTCLYAHISFLRYEKWLDTTTDISFSLWYVQKHQSKCFSVCVSKSLSIHKAVLQKICEAVGKNHSGCRCQVFWSKLDCFSLCGCGQKTSCCCPS